MKLSKFTHVLIAMTLSGCVISQTATSDICSHNLSKNELMSVKEPTSDFGNGNVGIYTSRDVSSPSKFSLLNCKTAEFAQVQSQSDIIRIKQIIDDMAAQGQLSSVNRFYASLENVSGISFVKSKAERNQDSRHSCACISFYPDEWYSGFPPGFVRPGSAQIQPID